MNGWIVISPYSGASPLVSCLPSPNPGTTGQTITFSAVPSSGTPPYSYSWSGTVSGSGQGASFVPTTAGTYAAYITVTDSNGKTGSNSCSVNVQQAGNALTILTSATLPYGTAGTAYSQTLTATGGTGSYTWSAVSSLPTGLALSTSGASAARLRPPEATPSTFKLQIREGTR